MAFLKLFGTLDYAKDTTANLFKLMMEATQEVKNSCFLCIQCAFESQNYHACPYVTDFCKGRLTFSELSLTSIDVACIIHLLKCPKCTDIHLSFNKCMLSVGDATALLKGIGDCQLSLTLKYVPTVNSPNSGHFGATAFVLYLESILYWGVLQNPCLNGVETELQ